VVKTLEALGFSFAPAAAEDTRAWLVTTKSDYRRLGGYTKYDDDPTSHYSYDSNVANSRQVVAAERLRRALHAQQMIGRHLVADQHDDGWVGEEGSIYQRKTGFGPHETRYLAQQAESLVDHVLHRAMLGRE
jgi:hypothetical protein